MREENAINFLLYSYFEVTLDNDEDELLEAAINRAYRDASSRVLSLKDNKKKKTAADEILKQIKKLAKVQKYDGWFYDLCDTLKKTFEGEEFNFGHAQKWVNMTMKYLFVLKSIFAKYKKDKQIFSWLQDGLEQQLHIPVDSYIMEAVAAGKTISVKRKPRDFSHGLDAKVLPGKRGGMGGYSSAKAWSTWKKGHYTDFRREIAGKIKGSPLDWEGPAWIEMARIRKEREKTTD